MDPANATDLTGIPVQYQVYVLYFVVGLKLAGQLVGAVRSGGGLRRIILSFWYGDNVPKAIAAEVRQKETSQTNPPFPSP